MEPQKSDKNYRAEDIQRYHAGKLSAAEMRAMELDALEDDFLAEAMEGYASVEEEKWAPALSQLQHPAVISSTAKVIKMKTGVRFLGWKIAAAVLVIAGGAIFGFLLTQKTSEQTLAVTTVTADSVTAEPGNASGDSSHLVAHNFTVNPKPKAAELSSIAARRTTEKRADSGYILRPALANQKLAEVEREEKTVDSLLQMNRDSTIALNDSNNPVADEKVLVAEAETARSQSKAIPATASLNKFSAQVTAPDGSPLPFANVSITKAGIGTYTDAKGRFRLVSGDSALQVEVKSVGYITKDFMLQNDRPQDKLVLNEDEFAVKEKTQVVGYAAGPAVLPKRRSILLPDSSATEVEPEDGWDNYDTYIANNLPTSEKISDRQVHGEVELSFEVQENGSLSNIKVDKSLCDYCDEAAMRVIKEGPHWKIKKGSQSSMGKVKLKF